VSRIANLINEWNRNTNGSVYRNELREALRWDRNSDKGLGDLVEQFFKTDAHAQRRAAGGVEQSQRIDYKKMWSLIDEKNGRASQVIEPILASGWNFEDIREEGKGRFDRALQGLEVLAPPSIRRRLKLSLEAASRKVQPSRGILAASCLFGSHRVKGTTCCGAQQ
jgi:hypothetical protein